MMKIFAVRDRLIDYYMQPFTGSNEKEVMAALAKTVNNNEDTNAITQAPHHFELWELGTVDEEGNITATRRLICDCTSLIRSGVRLRAEREGAEAAKAAGPHPALDRGNGQPRGAQRGAVQDAAPPATPDAGEVRREPQGGYPPRDRLDG